MPHSNRESSSGATDDKRRSRRREESRSRERRKQDRSRNTERDRNKSRKSSRRQEEGGERRLHGTEARLRSVKACGAAEVEMKSEHKAEEEGVDGRSSGTETETRGGATAKEAVRLWSKGPRQGFLARAVEAEGAATGGASPRDKVLFEGAVRSLFCLSQSNGLRAAANRLVDNYWFDQFIILAILVNCGFLAAWDPLEDQDSDRNQLLDRAELVFLLIFTIEMMLKIIAKGFALGNATYLKNPWNVLDFVVVLTGWTPLLPVSVLDENLSSIRIVRILRPIRALTSIPSLQVMIAALLNAFAQMRHVALLSLFVFLIFGISGVQLFEGALRRRCVDPAAPGVPISDRPCSTGSTGGFQCQGNSTCVSGFDNPGNGLIGFDNTAQAFLTIFQCITLEGWAEIMYDVEDATMLVSNLYFIFLIVIGSFFVLNLVLAVVCNSLAEAERDQSAKLVSDLSAASSASDEVRRKRVELVRKTKLRLVLQYEAGATHLLSKEQYKTYKKDVADMLGEQGGAAGVKVDDVDLTLDDFKDLPDLVTHDALIRRAELLIAHGEELLDQGHPATALKTLRTANKLMRGAQDAISKAREQIKKGIDPGRANDGLVGPLAPPRTAPAWRKNSYRIINSATFQAFITVCILVNTVLLCVEHYGQPDSTTDLLAVMNVILTSVYTVELVLKVMGLSLGGYAGDAFNLMDALVVVVSLIEIVILQSTTGGAFAAFRIFKLLRVLKITRNWRSLNRMVIIMGEALKSIGSFALLLLLFIFIFTLSGLQLFGGKLEPDPDTGETPRANFDDLLWGFVTVFQILTGEDWNEVMYDAADSTSTWSVLYFLALIIVGNFVVLNLFLAILISAFTKKQEEIDLLDRSRSLGVPLLRPQESGEENAARSASGASQAAPAADEATGSHRVLGALGGLDGTGGKSTAATPRPPAAASGLVSTPKTPATRSSSEKKGPVLAHPSFSYTSLGLLPPLSRLRIGFAKLVMNRWFDAFIFVCIAVNCVVLALDEPGVSADRKDAIDKVDLVLTGVFVTEFLLKVSAFGLAMHPGAYLRDPWNVLDLVVVITAVLGVATEDDALRGATALRAVRALRPLRLLNHMEELQVVMRSIVSTVPLCFNVMLVLVMFYVVSGIMAVNLFSGRLYSCNDPSRTCDPHAPGVTDCPSTAACVGVAQLNQPDGTLANLTRRWLNPSFGTGSSYSFDNIGIAVLTLFECSSLELYLDVLYRACDITSVGHAPRRNANQLASLFFVVYIFFTTFFALNIFISVVVDKFSEEKHTHGGHLFFTPRQRRYLELQKKAMLATSGEAEEGDRLKPPPGGCRRACFLLVTKPAFDRFITVAICVNVAVVATKHYEQADGWTVFQGVANAVFYFVFLVEMALKLLALGPRGYFGDRWNWLDFGIVVSTTATTVVELASSASGVDFTFLRMLRATRILRMIRASPRLRTLFQTLSGSLFALLNVGSLLLILFFIYAVAAMNLFGDAQRGEFINEHANFESLYRSMVTLLRMSTGEDWNGIMHEAMIDPHHPDCRSWSCYRWIAIPFFLSFLITGQYILLNLFIAVILERFEEELGTEQEPDEDVSPRDVEAFLSVWQGLVKASGSRDPELIPAKHLLDLLLRLPKPLGAPSASVPQLFHIVIELGIPVDCKGQIDRRVTLSRLIRRVYGEDLGEHPEVEFRLHRKSKSLKSIRLREEGMTAHTVDELLAAISIQRLFRKQRRSEGKVERGTKPDDEGGGVLSDPDCSPRKMIRTATRRVLTQNSRAIESGGDAKAPTADAVEVEEKE